MKKIILFSVVLGVCFIFLPQTSAFGNSVCAGGCEYTTIQEAIDATSAGGWIIVVDPVHTEAGIVVHKDMTIVGMGKNSTIVQAAYTPDYYTGRVFTISSGVTVTIQDMTIRYGFAGNSDGGGIHNSGSLTVNDSTITENETSYEGGHGGGLYNNDFASLVLNNSTVSDNWAWRQGGGVYNAGTLELNGSTISGNESWDTYGGGIYSDGPLSSLNISDSTVSGNYSDRDPDIESIGFLAVSNSTIGGSIHCLGDGRITESTIDGGSLYNQCRMRIYKTTVINSRGVFNALDGAIINRNDMDLIESTISENNTIGVDNHGTLTMINSTISNNLHIPAISAG